MDFFHGILEMIAEIAMVIFEFTGVIVILATGLIGIVNIIRRDPQTRLKIANGFATGLEFKLGGEILRTVMVRSINEIVVVGSIIVLRAALSFLIFWEIKNEQAHIKEQKEEILLQEQQREESLRADLLRQQQDLNKKSDEDSNE
jgi:uncharacterized membrane protein